ncbi:MAG: dockerin type I repeat-containing protein [Patescibacteria group bacterium]
MLGPRTILQYGTLVLMAVWLMSAGFASAVDVTVSAVVPEAPAEDPDTIIQFSGLAYPGGTVTIRQDGIVIATPTANSSASFSSSTIVTPGTHTYTLVGQDTQGRIGATVSYTLTFGEGTTTAVSNIFLGPTMALSIASITEAESVVVQGISVPSSTVTMYIVSTLAGGGSASQQFTVTANAQGAWTRTIAGSTLSAGSHIITPRATSGAQTSVDGPALVLAVAAVDQCAASTPGDINCDGSVDIVDFSILLYFWNATNPSQARADINADTTVNVIDFSILLYYWTG